MGLFDSLKQKKELKKFEESARENPSPLTVSQLAEKYLLVGKMNEARKVTVDALKEYPASERIVHLYQHIMKIGSQNKIVSLNKEIEVNPSAESYVRSAQFYLKEIGDLDKSLRVMRHGLKRFPNDENLHFLNGQIRLERFHREGFQCQDGLKALEHLHRAVDLNNLNYKAFLLLIKLLVEIEAYAEAWKFIGLMSRFAPDDAAINKLTRKLKNIPHESEDETPLSIGESAMEFNPLFQAIETRGGFSSQAQALTSFYNPESIGLLAAPLEVDKQKMHNLVKNFNEVSGFRVGAGFSLAGKVLFRMTKSNQVASESVIELMKSVCQTARESSKKMDIGRLSKGVLLSPLGRLHFFRIGSFTVACLFELSTKPEKIQSEINWLLDMMAMG
ncbi:MAG: hypothetical protein KAS70_04355 [Planctomycetes bacterium]|nr:hypothetical protein [Planctomycetota bacterium]